MESEDQMSTKTRRPYPEAFKEAAVRFVRESGQPAAQVARNLGGADLLRYRWCAEPQQVERCGQLRREQAVVKQTRDCLRHTAAGFWEGMGTQVSRATHLFSSLVANSRLPANTPSHATETSIGTDLEHPGCSFVIREILRLPLSLHTVLYPIRFTPVSILIRQKDSGSSKSYQTSSQIG